MNVGHLGDSLYAAHVHLVVDAVVDVFFDGAGKQDWFLTHDGHVGSQPLHVDVFDWFTI